MSYKYSYQKEIVAQRLADEISSSAITIALDYITTLGLGETMSVDIYFKAELPSEEILLLNAIVDAHIPTPIEPGATKVEVSNIAQVDINSQAPFATPLYRTKNDATESIVEVDVESVSGVEYVEQMIEYKILEEKYISGGEVIVMNAEFGDWMCASVYDKDGVIPEAYRSSLCEDWPIVARYINRRWLRPSDVATYAVVDTKPLNAKITAGLYLMVGYHAIVKGQNRKVVVNYDLQKKL